MKGSIAAAVTLALVATTSVQGMETFLKQIPNGSNFAKALGHSASGYTAFGTAFLEAGTTWSADFCKQTFPGSKITNGQAFGDPCCVWKTGAAAPQTVSAFTTNPGAGTTCATDAKPSTAPSTAPKATPAPASGGSGNNKPATTPKPASNNKPATTPKPASNNKPATTPKPASNNKPTPTKKPACKKKNRLL